MSGKLEHSPADILRRVLANLGTVSLPEENMSWPAFVAKEPDSPDDCVTTYDTPGAIDANSQLDGEAFEHYGIQLRVRAAKHVPGYTQASAVFDKVSRINRNLLSIGSKNYQVDAVTPTGGIASLGQDRSGNRYLFTINVIAALRQTN